ncbi:MAG: amidophosphoribosyltransferase [Pseudomonadota bacterium]
MNKRATEAATSTGMMPARGPRLLGTMGTHVEPEALILVGRRVHRVRAGDRAGRTDILAIAPGRVLVRHRGKEAVLTVPG